jgi:hypothetical protein
MVIAPFSILGKMEDRLFFTLICISSVAEHFTGRLVKETG